jgi:predicted NBD/HSP70 family sugar kinase
VRKIFPRLLLLDPLSADRGSNLFGVGQYNERVVLHCLRVHGPQPKSSLARLTGLTAQSIGLITQRLEDDGLITKLPAVRGKVGQPYVPLALNPDGAFSVGIKIGRRSTDWLLVDFCGQVRTRYSLTYSAPDALVLLPELESRLNQIIKSLGKKSRRVCGVGVAAPFLLGGWHSLLGLSAEKARIWNDIDLRSEVQAMTSFPVSFAKDTTAACVAELLSGRGRDLKNFLYVFIDTFIGGGLVLDSRLRVGSRANAGAIASLPIAGGKGTTPEQLISRASLWELEQLFKTQGLDAQAAYDERSASPPYDKTVKKWISSAAPALAQAIASGVAIADVDTIVIDGSVTNSVLLKLIEATRLALAQINWEGIWQPHLVQGQMGSDARALGGAYLPLRASFAPDYDAILKA